jgi:hypothetical protein
MPTVSNVMVGGVVGSEGFTVPGSRYRVREWRTAIGSSVPTSSRYYTNCKIRHDSVIFKLKVHLSTAIRMETGSF